MKPEPQMVRSDAHDAESAPDARADFVEDAPEQSFGGAVQDPTSSVGRERSRGDHEVHRVSSKGSFINGDVGQLINIICDRAERWGTSIDPDVATPAEAASDALIELATAEPLAEDAAVPPLELSLFDASKPWRLRPPQLPLDSADRGRWAAALRNEGLLLLISYDSALLVSAAQEIAAQLSDHYRTYLLSSHLGLEPGQTVTVNAFLPRQQEGPALIVADATEITPVFLDSVLATPASIQLFHQSLCDNERLLLVLTNDRALGWRDDPEGMRAQRGYLPCERVSFVRPRLMQQLGGNWQEAYEKLCRQREAGYWRRDEEGFFKEFTGYLNQGLLLTEIEKRRQMRLPPVAAEGAAGTLLSPQAPLENAVLFVATFFPNLSMRDFERLLLVLLGDRLQQASSTVFVLGPDGEGRGEEVTMSRTLREIWSETYPDIFLRCRLQMQSIESLADGASPRSIVDFTIPELRDELRSAFLGGHAPIFLPLFRLVRAARLPMAESQEVVSATFRLMVDTALANPGEFAGPGLGGLLPLPCSAASGAASEEVRESRLALRRYHPCLRAFLQRPQLRSRVIQFLQELLAARRFEELLDLAWTLRGVGEFKAFLWFKRLVDEGGEDAQRRVTARLRQGMRSGATSEVIQGVFRWLPQPGAASSGPAAAVAASFFVSLNEDQLFALRGRQPDVPAANPLLTAARIRGEDLEKYFVAWLFHPAAASCLRERVDEHFSRWIFSWLIPARLRPRVLAGRRTNGLLTASVERWAKAGGDAATNSEAPLDLLLFPALVLAGWAVELLGQEPQPVSTAAVYERLLTALAARCDAPRRLTLSILWSAVEESLLDLLVFVDELEWPAADLDVQAMKAIRTDMKNRRRCVKQLRMDLQTRCRGAATPR
jgi:hypothetical protein